MRMSPELDLTFKVELIALEAVRAVGEPPEPTAPAVDAPPMAAERLAA